MLAFFVEFVLELETLIVCLGGANGFDGGGDPMVHVPFTELARGDRTVTGVMVRKAAVPPDAGVDVVRQVQAFLVTSRFAVGAIDVDQRAPGAHAVPGFVRAALLAVTG